MVKVRRMQPGQLEQARIRSERELIYQSIRDLELDFETSKIEESEYQAMHSELRARALHLLQQARDTKPPQPHSAPDLVEPKTPELCNGCGTKLQAGWRFCPSCGAPPEGQAGDPAKANP